MRAFLTLILLVASIAGTPAAEIRNGAIMQVKPNSIWFEQATQLAEWQRLRKRRDAVAFEAYQKSELSERQAWQFINPLTVRILSHEPAKNRVHVKMKTKGRWPTPTGISTQNSLQPRALRR